MNCLRMGHFEKMDILIVNTFDMQRFRERQIKFNKFPQPSFGYADDESCFTIFTEQQGVYSSGRFNNLLKIQMKKNENLSYLAFHQCFTALFY